MQTLNDLWAAFLAERSISLSPTSLVTDYRQVTKWLARCPIQDPTQGRQILIWVLQQQPVKASRRVCMFVRSMYKWASAEDVALLQRNPVSNFRMPKAPQNNHEIVVIPRDEIELIIDSLNTAGNRGPRWSLFAEFMLQTGMRTGEVRALRWEDIEGDKILVHQNWTLTHGLKRSTKTNKQRWVPLNQRAKAILQQLPRDDAFLFPWNRSAFQKCFRTKVDKLYEKGLVKQRYRPYDLRHVAISRWLENGIPVTAAAKWAGNTSEVVWKHYAASTTEYEMPIL